MKIKNFKFAIILAISLMVVFNFSNCSGKKEQAKDKTVEGSNETVNNSNNLSNEGTVIVLTGDEFKKNIYNYDESKNWKFIGSKPCIVDFYADWCKPCKMVAPIMEELAKTYNGKITFYKVNVDNEAELSAAFNIESIPSILFCPGDGSEPQFSVGSMQKEEYVKVINDFLKVL